MKKPHKTPVMKKKCKTCPFRDGSPYTSLAPELAASALSGTEPRSRICHSTGSNAINHKTGIPQQICRGARDLQLKVFHKIGFLPAATDAAWDAKRKEMNC